MTDFRVKQILANRIQTPDGTTLQSFHRHDYVVHRDRITGEDYMVDGGTTYLRRSVNLEPAKDLSVYDTDPHEVIREAFAWGTRGKDGTSPLVFKPLCTLAEDHIKAILATQHHIQPHIRKVFEDEIAYRNSDNVKTVKQAYISMFVNGSLFIQENPNSPNVELIFNHNNTLTGIKLI